MSLWIPWKITSRYVHEVERRFDLVFPYDRCVLRDTIFSERFNDLVEDIRSSHEESNPADEDKNSSGSRMRNLSTTSRRI
jgi:hypothetical protein